MDIYEHLQAMEIFIAKRQWDELESEFRQVAEDLAGVETVRAIAQVNLVNYQNSLGADLEKAVSKARHHKAKAIYFEYDLDNGWYSNFFVCPAYNPPSDNSNLANDDWACDWEDEIEGPSMEAFARLYIPSFDRPEKAKGNTLYLVARTVTAFGRCAVQYDAENFAICIAFHDQNPIMRIKE